MRAAPDDALLAGYAVGDHEAAAAFIRRHQARVCGLARAIVGDPVLAEDVKHPAAALAEGGVGRAVAVQADHQHVRGEVGGPARPGARPRR
jgi:hypothetical protein